MRLSAAILFLALFAGGCTTRSAANANARTAYIAGQRDALAGVVAAQRTSVVVNGPVQNPEIQWTDGLTLAQAIAAANYTARGTPSEIILTRHGESASISPRDLLRGADVPLEPGDVIELRP
jgi:hypothetical protein